MSVGCDPNNQATEEDGRDVHRVHIHDNEMTMPERPRISRCASARPTPPAPGLGTSA